MQICGKKKPIDDSGKYNSDDDASYVEELEAYGGFAGTNIESQVRVVTPKTSRLPFFHLSIGCN